MVIMASFQLTGGQVKLIFHRNAFLCCKSLAVGFEPKRHIKQQLDANVLDLSSKKHLGCSPANVEPPNWNRNTWKEHLFRSSLTKQKREQRGKETFG